MTALADLLAAAAALKDEGERKLVLDGIAKLLDEWGHGDRHCDHSMSRGAIKTRRWREKKRSQEAVTVTVMAPSPPIKKGSPQTPPKENNLPPLF